LSSAFALLTQALSFVSRPLPLPLSPPSIPKHEGKIKQIIQSMSMKSMKNSFCISHVHFLVSEIIQAARLLQSE
jgi:hypothetical protein